MSIIKALVFLPVMTQKSLVATDVFRLWYSIAEKIVIHIFNIRQVGNFMQKFKSKINKENNTKPVSTKEENHSGKT